MDLAYDITRLTSRLFSVTPNGIDRIDFALAQHFLQPGNNRFGMLAAGLSPRVFPVEASRAAVASIGSHWGEDVDPDSDPNYLRLVAKISGDTHQSLLAVQAGETLRIIGGRPGRIKRASSFFAESGLHLGRSPKAHLPMGARYLSVSQFPLWISAYYKWLETRRDVRAIFFIHDLLPLDMPEYFRAGELERHKRRIANLARFGAGAIVTSETVRTELTKALDKFGRSEMPILVASVPSAPVFQTPQVREPQLAQHPYFVCCSTIEPRKNHLLLLNVWRELLKREGESAPKLVLVGARGWKYGALIELLENSPQLRNHVIEVAGLTSPAIKRLLDNACALLMPSFAEGYGLPVREALAGGLPVVASNIPVFQEIQNEKLRLLSPIDGEGWLLAIQTLAEASWIGDIKTRISSGLATSWPNYFDQLEAFIGSL